MSAETLDALMRAMLVASIGILVVMLLRIPIRRVLGSGAAYALWLLVPAVAMLSFLPGRRIVVKSLDAAVPLQQSSPEATVGAALEPGTSWTATLTDLAPALAVMWALGCVISLAVLVIRYRRVVGGLHLTPYSTEQGVFQSSGTGIGPAVIGVLRPRIVVPADFGQRFSAHEQALILAHERAHVAGLDAQVNGFAELALCLGWFNPLFHIARKMLRIDQELACDEQVMRLHVRQRRSYAEAMLKTQALRAVPLVCAWPPSGESSIRERLAMLARLPVHGGRRALALPVCASLTLAACAATVATQPPRVVGEAEAQMEDAQQRRDFFSALDPKLCTRWKLMCSAAADAVGDNPKKDESSRLGMHLVLALQNGDIAQAHKFIDAGADLNFYIPGDGTPLIIAAQKRDYSMARFLIEAGANVNRAAPMDGSPLIVAARNGDLDMAKLLIAHGADVNIYVPGDETPLINAARRNQVPVARYLIEHGADVNLAINDRTWTGRERQRSPLGEAERLHHGEMIRLLREHNAST